MKRLLFKLLFIFLSIVGMHWQFALAENYYGMANDYLQYGAGARSLAMGGAYVALADEASAPYWNPAGLTQISQHQFLSMYAPFFEETTYSFVSYVHPLGRLGTLAISDVFLHSAGYEEVDYEGNVLGSNKSIYKNVLIISYANRLHRRFSLGATVKLVYEQVMEYSGNGQGMDLGMLYEPLNGMKIGLAVQNVIQPRVALRAEADAYKINFKGGLAVKTLSNHLTLTADVNKLVDEKEYFSAGLEISSSEKTTSSLLKRIDLRAGFNNLQSLTCGLGLKIGFLTVDYAFNTHEMGNLHKFAITFSWGTIPKGTAEPVLNSGKSHTRF